MKKKFIKIVKITFLLGIILIIGLIYIIKNDWKNFTTKKEISDIINDIKASEPLPDKLYNLYEVEYPNSFEYDINHQVFNSIISEKYVTPPSEQVSRLSQITLNNINDNRRLITRNLTLAWLIEKETTQKECFNWIAANYDFLNRAIGVKKASIYYFKKELHNLDEYELATLAVMLKNPSLYNPLRRKELVDKEVEKLLTKYHDEND